MEIDFPVRRIGGQQILASIALRVLGGSNPLGDSNLRFLLSCQQYAEPGPAGGNCFPSGRGPRGAIEVLSH